MPLFPLIHLLIIAAVRSPGAGPPRASHRAPHSPTGLSSDQRASPQSHTSTCVRTPHGDVNVLHATPSPRLRHHGARSSRDAHRARPLRRQLPRSPRGHCMEHPGHGALDGRRQRVLAVAERRQAGDRRRTDGPPEQRSGTVTPRINIKRMLTTDPTVAHDPRACNTQTRACAQMQTRNAQRIAFESLLISHHRRRSRPLTAYWGMCS